MNNVKVSFEIPDNFSVELQLMSVLNQAILHFTVDAVPGKGLPPEAVDRAVVWLRQKWGRPA